MTDVKIRLAEIAERAGVSVSTVSRVLNDKPGVNQATRRQVLTAVDVLGYDRPARLRPRSGGLVGLVVPELENPFFPRFAQAIENHLKQRGYTPVLCTMSLGGIHEDDYVATLLEHGVSGIIFVSGVHAMPATDPRRYRRLTETGLPVVLVNGHLPDVGAASFSTDDVAAMDLGVMHVAHMGHERVGLAIGQLRYTPAMRKAVGFREAVARHVPGGPPGRVVETTYTVEGGLQAGHALLDEGVTAVLCGSDVMALGVVRAARQRGLRVPEDLSVVGSDDSTLIEFTDPPLTTLRQPTMALAAAVSRSLVDQVGGAAPPPDEVLFQPELVVRHSTARAPQEAPPERPVALASHR